jgi:nicotinamide mononucleotide transporter
MTGALEIAANAVMTVSIFLAGRNSVHTWWTGIIGCILFALMFFQVQLYADVALQAFFVVTSAAGWRRWLTGEKGEQGEKSESGGPLPVSAASVRQLAWTVPIGVGATAIYGALLHFFTNAYAPFIDSTVLVFSVIAQLLLMQRRMETWAFWLLVNSIAAPLYASRGLYLTAFFYALYWANAFVSWCSWRRLARHSEAGPAAP